MLKLLIIAVFILALGGILIFGLKTQKQKKSPPKQELPKTMRVSSPAFANQGKIPQKYTCDGEDINPPLEIKDVPEGSQSLVLLVDDPDAPVGTFLHWLVFNINPDINFIEENSLPKGAVQGRNDFGKVSYGGPCPATGEHRYFFKIYALDKKLNLGKGASLKEVKAAMEGHLLDQAQLIGLYQRS